MREVTNTKALPNDDSNSFTGVPFRTSGRSASPRSFLFLQGVNTPFFPRLADQLLAAGHRVHRINFNVGDAVFWRLFGKTTSTAFRGKLKNLAVFLLKQFHSHDVTDILLFGDRRPIHLPAITLAKQNNVRVHVFEEGYFRPNWVTLERDGVNADSLLPRDPAWFREACKALPDDMESTAFLSSLTSRALYDMVYHLFNFWNPLFFPRYRTHRPFISAIEYLGWARRFSMMPRYELQDQVAITKTVSGTAPYFILPLQLDSDAQIRDHSQFNNMAEVIELTMASFAHHAAQDARLIIKNHPLDTGFTNYRKLIRALATKLAIQDRIDYLESGDLDLLLAPNDGDLQSRARGLVTVNSTVGLASLGFNCPTITLSNPLYNLVGLTFQGHLDQFWLNATAPDVDLFQCFKKTLIYATQINGGYYSKDGIALAVKNAARIVTADQSPLETLL